VFCTTRYPISVQEFSSASHYGASFQDLKHGVVKAHAYSDIWSSIACSDDMVLK